MRIYIASSWKNQHGVEMLTHLLREQGHEVISWIENYYKQPKKLTTGTERWINSDESNPCFQFDTQGATQCDLLIYYGPAGKDACAELGAAWSAGVPIIGLCPPNGEDLGLMRKMVGKWYERYTDVIEACREYGQQSEPRHKKQKISGWDLIEMLMKKDVVFKIALKEHEGYMGFYAKHIALNFQASNVMETERERIVITAHDWFVD